MPHARKADAVLPHPEPFPVGVSALTFSEELSLVQWFVGSAKRESKSELSKSTILDTHGRGVLAVWLPAGPSIGRLADCPIPAADKLSRGVCIAS